MTKVNILDSRTSGCQAPDRHGFVFGAVSEQSAVRRECERLRATLSGQCEYLFARGRVPDNDARTEARGDARTVWGKCGGLEARSSPAPELSARFEIPPADFGSL